MAKKIKSGSLSKYCFKEVSGIKCHFKRRRPPCADLSTGSVLSLSLLWYNQFIMKKQKKGFTLIELLVVIAIIAILSIVVVLTLNPAEMLRRSRDSNRVSDLSTMRSAIALYLTDVSTTSMGAAGTCYMQYTGTVPVNIFEFATTSASEASSTVSSVVASATTCKPWFNTQSLTTIASSSRNTASGWVPIDLTKISTGAPIGQWPADPASDAGVLGTGPVSAGNLYFYIPGSSNNQYKLAAKMESANYSASGTSDVESTDGGVDQFMYELGSGLQL
jgi:prepilin-type N-terminal cleavage/methylation domain-containing protein